MSTDLQRAVIGGILADPRLLAEAQAKLTDEAFSSILAEVYRVLVVLGDRGAPITTQSVRAEWGDRADVALLADLELSAPDLSRFDYYVDELADASVRAQLRAKAEAVLRSDRRGAEMGSELIHLAEGLLSGLGDGEMHLLGEGIAEWLEALEDARGKVGVQVGFPSLDSLTQGFRPGQLIIIAGRPGQGKTSIALNMAWTVAKAGGTVGLWSLEMSDEELKLRALADESNIGASSIRSARLQPDEWQQALDAARGIAGAPVWVDDRADGDLGRISASIRRFHYKHSPKLIIIDYLQLMHGSGKSSRQEEVAEITRRLKLLAKDLQVPIIVLAQLNREAEKAGRDPRLSDLRESGGVEQDADMVLFVVLDVKEEQRAKSADKLVPARLLVSKHRNGATGVIQLFFHRPITRFSEHILPGYRVEG